MDWEQAPAVKSWAMLLKVDVVDFNGAGRIQADARWGCPEWGSSAVWGNGCVCRQLRAGQEAAGGPRTRRAETHGISFRIQISVKEVLDTDVLLKLLFHLPVNYPSTVPDISVTSEQLTRAQCMDVREKLLEEAKKHLSEPMVHDLILWVQQHLKDVIKQSATVFNEKPTLSKVTEDGIWMLLLNLDHMRAKAKYVKTVEKWASDLRLTGRLMFMGKIILILLQGDRNSIKEYLILQKTSKVDVDSSGKKCKEKMMRVLCETELQSQHKRFQTFEVKEYSAPEELQKEFETAGLKTLFSEFVSPLLK
uniref:RWD domain-containing protein 3 n=1 Tax=Agelaius phoeniceus TaxID=39638 RepID=UPI0023EBB3A7|nr:RWD domain-containing protein 3 [Agelaius phoeniceus]